MYRSIPIWKKAPFLRLVIPLAAGIIIQWYFQPARHMAIAAATCFSIGVLLFQCLPLAFRYFLRPVQGVFINLLVGSLGMLLTYQNDVRHQQEWFGHYYHDTDYLVLTINAPLQEKDKSFKADALVHKVISSGRIRDVTGKIVLYFAKDTQPVGLRYGEKIIIHKKIQPIHNSGNPGTFDYRQYASFKQLFHTVYLKKDEWVILPEKHINYLNGFLFGTRQNILDVFQRYMPGKDDQVAIAEALLIGYTQDLDKDLVQAYSNAGVVHIIAISGMHLGLIYVILIWLFQRIPFVRRSTIIKTFFVLSCLWLFALLTGGGASVLRSAVMFSCIVIGENFSKKASIYNSLAASAFFLLCFNPYYLWDAGFQLSYFALLGIVIFQKPIYRLLFFKRMFLNRIWQLTAVSIAAQIFTFPVCLYYFHQFPTLFLFTNVIAVPLSTLILFVEIFLVALAWLPFAGVLLGKFTWFLIWLMNKIIFFFNALPFAVWDGIPATVSSTLLLYFFVGSVAFWLLHKSKSAFTLSLLALLTFMFLRAFEKWQFFRQQKLIVYNIPQSRAIDFVYGNNFRCIADSSLRSNKPLQNFHIKPGRISMQLEKEDNQLESLYQKGNFFRFGHKVILLINAPVSFQPLKDKFNVDYIVISGNAKLFMSRIASAFNCKQYIFDASNSLWKIGKWKQECQLLHLPFYSVPEQGAFVTDL